MKESTLTFTVCLKADEATLLNIKNKLTHTKSTPPTLTNKLVKMIKQTLVTAGITNDFEIELHHSHLVTHHKGAGGLSAHEWLEAEEISRHLSGN